MARKRLSDLLREEAKKPADPETSAEKDSEVAVSSNDTAVAKASAGNSKDARSTKPPSTVPPEQPAAEASPDAVVELKNALAAAETREEELKEQVAELTLDLKTQTTSAKKLQTALEKAEQRNQELEAELAEAKQTALQLAEANSQLKQAASPPKQQAAKALQPAEQKTAGSAPLTQQEMIRRRQERSLAHPIFPTGKPPGQLSEQDMGWVD